MNSSIISASSVQRVIAFAIMGTAVISFAFVAQGVRAEDVVTDVVETEDTPTVIVDDSSSEEEGEDESTKFKYSSRWGDSEDGDDEGDDSEDGDDEGDDSEDGDDEENSCEPSDDEDEVGSDPKSGIITIINQVVGGVIDWSFTIDGYTLGDFTLTDEDDSETFSGLASGEYIFGEYIPTNWDVTDVTCNDSDSSIKVDNGPLILNLAEGENVTCIFTNTYFPSQVVTCEDDSALNYGEEGSCEYSGGDENTYRLEGYVWNDANSNDIIDEGEADLSGWTVTATNGSTTVTTTDAEGHYVFNVPAGTWTITETLQSSWSQTFPNAGTHVVTLPEVVSATPFNFGNVFTGCTTNCGGGSNGGGHHGGSGSKKKKTSTSNDTPDGEVLGAATSVMPVGAPDTGAGGTSPIAPTLPTLVAILSTGSSTRRGA